MNRLEVLEERRKVMKEYLQHRVDDEDWHGVMDASADLREIDTEIRVLSAKKN